MSAEYSEEKLRELIRIYNNIKPVIVNRLLEFEEIWERSDEHAMFMELAFCLFTPQSRARNCWKAVTSLEKSGMLFNASASDIANKINEVRFRNNKAAYLVSARNMVIDNGHIAIKEKLTKFPTPFKIREWLVNNIKGLGYKEATHFLRNIGMGDNLAILDRHILNILKEVGAIDEIPRNMSRKKYLEIEKDMQSLAEYLNIPMTHLDLVMWYRKVGEVFK